MQNHIWGKTLLSVYRYLERLAGALDRIIEKRATQTSSMLGKDCLTNNTLTLTSKLIELSERKVKLINIKLLVEASLASIDEKQAKILILKYFDKAEPEKIMQALSLPRRTFYRKLTEAESAFESKFVCSGFPIERLERYLCDEGWIIEVKESIESGNENVSAKKLKIC